MKDFCSVKDPVMRIKRQSGDWEKIFANHIYNKELDVEYIIKNTQDSTEKKNQAPQLGNE